MRYSFTTACKIVQHQGLHYNRMEKSNFKLFLEDCATYHTEDIVYQAMVKVIPRVHRDLNAGRQPG